MTSARSPLDAANLGRSGRTDSGVHASFVVVPAGSVCPEDGVPVDYGTDPVLTFSAPEGAKHGRSKKVIDGPEGLVLVVKVVKGDLPSGGGPSLQGVLLEEKVLAAGQGAMAPDDLCPPVPFSSRRVVPAALDLGEPDGRQEMIKGEDDRVVKVMGRSCLSWSLRQEEVAVVAARLVGPPKGLGVPSARDDRDGGTVPRAVSGVDKGLVPVKTALGRAADLEKKGPLVAGAEAPGGEDCPGGSNNQSPSIVTFAEGMALGQGSQPSGDPGQVGREIAGQRRVRCPLQSLAQLEEAVNRAAASPGPSRGRAGVPPRGGPPVSDQFA